LIKIIVCIDGADTQRRMPTILGGGGRALP
jgi:hypothetical protein